MACTGSFMVSLFYWWVVKNFELSFRDHYIITLITNILIAWYGYRISIFT